MELLVELAVDDVALPFATADTQCPIPSWPCSPARELDADADPDADVVLEDDSDASSAALHAATADVTADPWFSDELESDPVSLVSSVSDFDDEVDEASD